MQLIFRKWVYNKLYPGGAALHSKGQRQAARNTTSGIVKLVSVVHNAIQVLVGLLFADPAVTAQCAVPAQLAPPGRAAAAAAQQASSSRRLLNATARELAAAKALASAAWQVGMHRNQTPATASRVGCWAGNHVQPSCPLYVACSSCTSRPCTFL
jgi:hypothetical protein